MNANRSKKKGVTPAGAETTPAGGPTRRLEKTFVIMVLLLGAFLFVRAAWVSEDAYITFRTIDNFVNGYGLRWNIVERVQSYTHPLWMFLMTLFFLMTREFYFTTIVISLILSFATVWLVAQKLSVTAYSAFPAIFALLSSKAFVDYTSSGLETPLSFFLLALFYLFFFKREFKLRTLLLLFLIACLAALNRLDTILFYVPPLAYFVYRTRKDEGLAWSSIWKAALLGFLPLIGWFVFSIVYYGFPFPNTAYAKLNAGVPEAMLLAQGLKYLVYSIRNDTVTPAVIFFAIGYTLFRSKGKFLFAGIGMAAYVIYVWGIGGDFMAGRFFALPVLSSAMLLGKLDFKRSLGLAVAGVLVIVGLLVPKPTYLYSNAYEDTVIGKSGITDERGFYYQVSGLLKMLSIGAREPVSPWIEEARLYKAKGIRMVARETVGYFGYYIGPKVYIVDLLALNDPLLARLKIPDTNNWRIGHFRRALPEGYLESLATGKNEIHSPRISMLYDDLNVITRGKIWSADRFKAMVRVNLGE